jgi:hypothetical protein
MFPIRIPLPLAALTRIVSQTAEPSDLQSCQAELTFTVRNYADTDTYLATPGNQYYVSINDTNNILPYTVVRFNIGITPVAPSAWSPYSAGLWVTAADTTPALAAARLAAQMNLFAQTMVSWGYPAFRSFRAQANGMDIRIRMPWGMLGILDYDTDGPDGAEAVVVGFGGVDHPLWFSLLGPRRHCLRVLPTYPGPYYGDPIG